MSLINAIRDILKDAGITINGTNPYDIQVHDKRFYQRVFKDRAIGAGESYVEGWWDCEELDNFFHRIIQAHLYEKVETKWRTWLIEFKNSLFNNQSRGEKANQVAYTHYNVGNKLFQCMLGESMAYTCAYWKDALSLNEAQFNKYDLICKKLYLKSGEKILDLGCGFGGLAKYIAEHYDCEVVGVNISEEQVRFARDFNKNLPVKIFLCDYRDYNTYNPNHIEFDKVVSVGMFEHVGLKNHKKFIDIFRQNLKKDGLGLIHAIGSINSSNYLDPWIEKYIFPNTILPSIKQTADACEKKFVIEDLHNFGADYDRTCVAWHHNLNHHWSEIASDYDNKCRRMWNYYLLSASAVFRARITQLFQTVVSPHGVHDGYISIR